MLRTSEVEHFFGGVGMSHEDFVVHRPLSGMPEDPDLERFDLDMETFFQLDTLRRKIFLNNAYRREARKSKGHGLREINILRDRVRKRYGLMP